jgi:hypothetical protein
VDEWLDKQARKSSSYWSLVSADDDRTKLNAALQRLSTASQLMNSILLFELYVADRGAPWSVL